MRKLLFWLLTAILAFCGTSAKAIDFLNMEPMKLTTPEMEPKLDYSVRTAKFGKTVKLDAPELVNTPDVNKYQLTWMRTNPGVEPYKVMDDLTFVGVPVFLAGLIAKSEKSAFRQNTGDNKHVLLTDFKTGIDDYTQFFGPVVTTGLKIAGVESRSDWGRYLATTAMSYAIMAGFVNGIKYTAKEMRPDGSSANSWPSGHTATAFVGASILHKEYGMTRSPWFSVAGYTVATATGVMRVLNNRHWISDVLSGAGIGIMSTELAYALSDVFFKGKGLLRGSISADRNIIEHPSFFSISMGLGFGSRDIDFDMGDMSFTDLEDHDKAFNLKFRASTAVAAEGAYFFNKYFGVGGRLRVNAAPIKGWDGIEAYAWNDLLVTYANLYEQDDMRVIVEGDANRDPYLTDVEMTIKSDHLTEFAADLGLYFNLPLSNRFALGTKLLIGRSIMQEIDLNAKAKGGVWTYDIDDNFIAQNIQYHGEYETEWDYFMVSANNTMKYGTGLSLTYAYKENFAWKLFFDYDFARKTYTLDYNPLGYVPSAFPLFREFMQTAPEFFTNSQSVKKNRHTFVLGGSFVVSF